MNNCLDCKIKLRGHNKPKRCVSCNRLHRSIYFRQSEETKQKISKSKKKNKDTKFCSKCNSVVSFRNKTGLCQPCSKTGNWCVGLKINNLEFINREGKNDSGYEVWRIKCHCGKVFVSIASKIKLGRVKSCGCSHIEHCKKIGQSQKGENNPMWIKDRTKTSCFIRNKDCIRNKSGSWQYFSRKYKKEKNYTCELTGEKMNTGELHVHHIESVVIRPDLVLDRNNVICINKEIHNEFHNIYGKITNRRQWEEFVKNNYSPNSQRCYK